MAGRNDSYMHSWESPRSFPLTTPSGEAPLRSSEEVTMRSKQKNIALQDEAATKVHNKNAEDATTTESTNRGSQKLSATSSVASEQHFCRGSLWCFQEISTRCTTYRGVCYLNTKVQTILEVYLSSQSRHMHTFLKRSAHISVNWAGSSFWPSNQRGLPPSHKLSQNLSNFRNTLKKNKYQNLPLNKF